MFAKVLIFALLGMALVSAVPTSLEAKELTHVNANHQAKPRLPIPDFIKKVLKDLKDKVDDLSVQAQTAIDSQMQKMIEEINLAEEECPDDKCKAIAEEAKENVQNIASALKSKISTLQEIVDNIINKLISKARAAQLQKNYNFKSIVYNFLKTVEIVVDTISDQADKSVEESSQKLIAFLQEADKKTNGKYETIFASIESAVKTLSLTWRNDIDDFKNKTDSYINSLIPQTDENPAKA